MDRGIMIALANALTSSLAYLQCQKAGHTMGLPLNAAKGYNLSYWISGKRLTLQLRTDGNQI